MPWIRRSTFNGREYVFIDTAGLRRKNKIKEDLEHYMIVRTVGAVERADVVILVIDAVEGVTEQDAKIAGIAHERGKGDHHCRQQVGCRGKGRQDHLRVLRKRSEDTLSFMQYAEIVFISAKDRAEYFPSCLKP